jgi:hypothetical protein
MPEIIHTNHVGVAAAVAASEVVLTANTVSVFYDAGWPVSRPSAPHVLAVGGDAEPSWLTDDDLWVEGDASGAAASGSASVATIPYAGTYGGPTARTLPTGMYEPGNVLVAVSFELDAAVSIDRLACEVTVAGTAGAEVHVGIYDSLSSGLPGQLVASGTVDGATTGVKEATVSASLQKGRYWVGAVSNRTGADRPQLRGWFDVHVGASIGRTTFANQVANEGAGLQRFDVTATLPATFGTVNTNTQRRAPFIAVRFA